ncbi:MAG TPA: sigma factor-like helix-turn-helix DNA-binding protein [Nitrososphaera sp.]|nr:sigma factor-like helix-turn-helix DNA-binding protein [Nitrososphaera sp.]
MLQQDRCTQNDYLQLFADSEERLHWLCHTLTGNKTLSEKVMSLALEQSQKGAERVFREWMVSWARRLMIKACAEIVRPWTSPVAAQPSSLLCTAQDVVNRNHIDAALALPSRVLQERLLKLDALYRFVFVLRAVEGYSRREASLLLNIDDRLCEWIYVRVVSDVEREWAAMEFSCNAGVANEAKACVGQAGN